MYHFPWGASAVKRSMEQNLQVKLKGKLTGNMSATLCFTGIIIIIIIIIIISVIFFGAKTIKLLYGHILESCQSIYSVLTDHRSDNV